MRHLALGMVLLLAAGAARAQIVGNGLGTSVNTPTGAVTISGGTSVGNNLFHSFSTFNVATGDSATFTGSSSLANIIARVTGGASSIDGTLRTATGGTTSLWLINPAGVAFGQNAQLDVTGSFHASTAHALKFGSSGQFDMTNPPAGTLTVSPTAFVFLSPPAPITVNGAQLSVPAGQQISLVGGDIAINGATFHALAGQINLASVRSAGEVGVGAGSLSASGVTAFGDITLANSNLNTWGGIVDPTQVGATSDPIFIRGGKLTMNQSTVSSALNGAGTGADIDIALSGDFSMTGGALETTSTGTGNAGVLTLQAANITASGAALIDTSAVNSAGGGRAGAMTISASGDVALSGGAQLTSVTYSASGQGGDLHITARNLTVSGNPTMISVATFGDGAGGNIQLDVSSLSITAGGRIAAANAEHPLNGPGAGNGGNIVINAADGVSLSGAGSAILATSAGFGDAGSINITAGHAVSLTNGAQISTAATSAGGGRITITATDLVSLDHSKITTSVFTGVGNGGDITIDPTFVTLNVSQIIAQTFDGQGGHINIVTPNFVCPDCGIAGGSLISAAALGGNGVPGTVQVSSPNVDAGSSLAVLPSAFFDPSALLRESCATRGARLASSFTGAGRGALPAGPDAARYGPYALGPVSAAVLASARVTQAGQSALQGCSG